jgi:adenylate kinase family enzyme
MRIFIEGNMASGKSLYTKALARLFKLEHMSMDIARRQVWNEGDMAPTAREGEARRRIVKWISMRDSFIFERIGTGRFDERVDELVDEPITRMLIKASPTKCIHRFNDRQDAASTRIMLPDYMGDPEAFIYRNAEDLLARERAGFYSLVIENDREKTIEIFKGEILGIREKLMGK